MTKQFYEFSQNNSGGGFDVDKKVCNKVFIEAESADEANAIAQELGIYFDGVEKGIDCGCCGDRWYEAYRPAMEGIWSFDTGETTAEVFDYDIEKYAQFLADEFGWTTPDARIFYANGLVTEVFSEKERAKIRTYEAK